MRGEERGVDQGVTRVGQVLQREKAATAVGPGSDDQCHAVTLAGFQCHAGPTLGACFVEQIE